MWSWLSGFNHYLIYRKRKPVHVILNTVLLATSTFLGSVAVYLGHIGFTVWFVPVAVYLLYVQIQRDKVACIVFDRAAHVNLMNKKLQNDIERLKRIIEEQKRVNV